MTSYLIPKEHHKDLYIFEGALHNFIISNNKLTILVNSVDYPDLPPEIPCPNYLDFIKIEFINFSYLKFETGYKCNNLRTDNILEFGNLSVEMEEELLDYGGTLYALGKSNIPTSFTIEIVCTDIKLIFI